VSTIYVIVLLPTVKQLSESELSSVYNKYIIIDQYLPHIWSYDGLYIDGVESCSTHVDVLLCGAMVSTSISVPSHSSKTIGQSRHIKVVLRSCHILMDGWEYYIVNMAVAFFEFFIKLNGVTVNLDDIIFKRQMHLNN